MKILGPSDRGRVLLDNMFLPNLTRGSVRLSVTEKQLLWEAALRSLRLSYVPEHPGRTWVCWEPAPTQETTPFDRLDTPTNTDYPAIVEDQPNYTIKAAARRVRRSTRTIEQWIADGLPSRKFRGITIIDHDPLIAEMKKRNRANPNKRGIFARLDRENDQASEF